MDEKQLSRKNNSLGIALFLIVVVLFGATIGISYLYLSLD